MDKKPKKKPMFVMKETLVHLTPHQMGFKALGASFFAKPTDTDPTEPGCQLYTCVYTKY